MLSEYGSWLSFRTSKSENLKYHLHAALLCKLAGGIYNAIKDLLIIKCLMHREVTGQKQKIKIGR